MQKYIIYVTAMRKKEESLRKLKKGKKTPFSLFGGGPKEEDGRDKERIRQQMVLDVETFEKNAKALGVDVQGSASFKSLLERVIAPLNDGELGTYPLNPSITNNEDPADVSDPQENNLRYL